ncbi:cell division protein FtsI [Geomicrobium sp. JCM 19037]|uniref:hypothetical protein n=1 Tax=Geomicrobium sp. JCM 19037 TaxID=1460634 RepID=UPI00045F2A28|nr:hypothetical protein [Geomicrobium sp. JCM 19037]GAK05721.1 cell division protein FtsI [Geomicrobium sp. JCM 19037]
MAEHKRKNHIPFRLNILFVGVFILFSILILRLGYIQIVQGDSYERMLTNEEEQTVNVEAPRGIMFDRNNYVLVDNDLQLALTYTNTPNNDRERYEIAHGLVEYLEIEEDDIESVNPREWKDYFLYTASIEPTGDDDEDGPLREYVANIVTDDEASELEDDEIYQLQLDRLNDEDIMNSYSESEQQAVVIWAEMLSGYNHSPNRIATGLDEEQAHRLAEMLHHMPGTDLMRDAERIYPYGEQFTEFFGSIGSIPSELISGYVGRGYERSDQVGVSYLENEYEEVLRGEKAVVRTQPDGSVITDEGRRGNDLRLTIDMRLQQDVTDLVSDVLHSYGGHVFPDGRDAYVVMIEPSTGDILSLVV